MRQGLTTAFLGYPTLGSISRFCRPKALQNLPSLTPAGVTQEQAARRGAERPGGLGGRDAELICTRWLCPDRALPLILDDKRRYQSFLIVRRVDTDPRVVPFEIAAGSAAEFRGELMDGPAGSRMVQSRGSVSAGPDPRRCLDPEGSQ